MVPVTQPGLCPKAELIVHVGDQLPSNMGREYHIV